MKCKNEAGPTALNSNCVGSPVPFHGHSLTKHRLEFVGLQDRLRLNAKIVRSSHGDRREAASNSGGRSVLNDIEWASVDHDSFCVRRHFSERT
jgi:hypothetical protein